MIQRDTGGNNGTGQPHDNYMTIHMTEKSIPLWQGKEGGLVRQAGASNEDSDLGTVRHAHAGLWRFIDAAVLWKEGGGLQMCNTPSVRIPRPPPTNPTDSAHSIIHLYLSPCVPPRTHHTNLEVPITVSAVCPGRWKWTTHAWPEPGRTSSVVDQYVSC